MASNTITVAFQSSTGGFNKGLNSTQRSLLGMQKNTRGASLGVGSLVKAFAGFQVVSKSMDFIRDSIADARESNKISAQTRAAIKATGGAANVTAKQVGNLSESLSNKTAIDDEVVQSGANLLLTFKNIRNEAGKGNAIYDRATAAALDLSKAGFGSVESASKQLGKALNDPIKGVSALGRAGVTFTQGQKDQIAALVKSGDTLKAQKIILGEVQSQVGGSAAAQATAGERLQVVIGNIREDLGNKLIPIIERTSTFLSDNLPAAIDATGSAFGRIKGVVAGFVSAGQGVTNFVKNNQTTFTVLGGIIGAVFLPLLIQTTAAFIANAASVALTNTAWLIYGLTTKAVAIGTRTMAAAQWLLNAAMSANPLALVVKGLVLLGAGLILAYQKSATFRAIVQGAFNGVKAAGSALWAGIKAAFKGIQVAISVAGKAVSIYLLPARVAFKVLSAAARAVLPAIKGAFNNVVSFVKGVPGKIKGAFGSAKTMLSGIGKDIMRGLTAGIADAGRAAVQKAKDVAGNVKNAVTGFFKIKSPSRVMRDEVGFQIMRGLILGLERGQSPLARTLSSISGQVAGTPMALAANGGSLPRAARGGDTYYVTVQVDSSMTLEERGAEIDKALNAARAVGRVRR